MRPLVILCVLVVVGTTLRMVDFDQPWHNEAHTQGLKGFGGALYGNIGRNHVRYGYVATRGAMVNCGGQRTVAELANHRYVNHPPLVGILLSLSFHSFGVSETSARAVPIVASVLAMIVLFFAVRAAAGVVIALLATAFFATMPMAVYYGGFVEVQGSQVMLAVIAIAAIYFRWHETRRRAWLVGLFAAVVVGAFLDWPVYLLAVALWLHHLVAPGTHGRRRAIWLGLPMVAILCFAANVAYASLLSGGIGQLLLAFTLENQGASADAAGWGAWWDANRGYALGMYGAPVLALAGLALLGSAIASLSRRVVPGAALAFVFIATGLLYSTIFRKGAILHEYWSQHLSPGLAIAAAIAVWAAARAFGTGRGRIVAAAVGGVALAGWLGWESWQRYEPRIERESSYYVRAGAALRDASAPEEVVTIVGNLGEQPIYTFYADRTIHLVDARVAFESGDLPARIRGRWVAIPRSLTDHPIWHDELVFEPVRKHFEDLLGHVAEPTVAGPLLLYRVPAAPPTR